MRCPSCGSSAVLYEKLKGELVCTQCGLVVLERAPELGQEWRRRPGEKSERADGSVGMDITQHDFGMGSEFRVPLRASPGTRARLRRMQLLHRRARVGGWRERSLREALLDLGKLCEALALPRGIKVEVSVQYRRARAKRITSGRDTHQVLAALIFITCRMRGLPRTEGEILATLGARFGEKKCASPKSFRRLTRLLAQKLKLKMRRISARDYINRFAPQLGISTEAVKQAHDFYEILPPSFTQTKPPRLMAAVAIYLGVESKGEKITLLKISSDVGVGVSSLSKNIKHARGFLSKK